MRRATWLRAGSVVALGAWMLLVAALNTCCTSPLRVDPLRRSTPAPVVDEDLELARAYAPWILHEVHATGGRQDIPSAMDFDGNLSGDDNWQNMPLFELVPTVSYAHVETKTHHFLTYHVFHPRDWEPFDLGVHMTHEGDGENLQVVVEKRSGRVVLLFAQAHYCGRVYAGSDYGFSAGSTEISGDLLLLDAAGRPDPAGKHAVVFVESKGHGIYGALDSDSRARVGNDGRITFERQGMVLKPANPGEIVVEPDPAVSSPVAYLLESTHATLWPLLVRGEISGEGRPLDGDVRYAGARVAIDLPRFHRGDRFSGPFGSSRGISPFAVDVDWSEGTLGSLLFDPAERYAQILTVPAVVARVRRLPVGRAVIARHALNGPRSRAWRRVHPEFRRARPKPCRRGR